VTEREVSEGSPFGAFPADCPLVRRILTAVSYDSEYRSAV
jgi:hypothetical protein